MPSSPVRCLGILFFADEYHGFDDAFYALGRILRILSNTDQPLSQLFSDVATYYSTAETRIPCPDERKVQIVEELKRQLAKSYEIIDVDGVRALFEDGWGLFRCSNTQPVIVARCEAKHPESLQSKRRLLASTSRRLLFFLGAVTATAPGLEMSLFLSNQPFVTNTLSEVAAAFPSLAHQSLA